MSLGISGDLFDSISVLSHSREDERELGWRKNGGRERSGNRSQSPLDVSTQVSEQWGGRTEEDNLLHCFFPPVPFFSTTSKDQLVRKGSLGLKDPVLRT